MPDGALAEFEMSNVVGLGLVRYFHETDPYAEPIDVPFFAWKSVSVAVPIQRESSDGYSLTQLGELFFEACTETREEEYCGQFRCARTNSASDPLRSVR